MAISRQADFRLQSRHHAGMAMLYLIVMLLAMVAFCSLAVDLGRVQLAKTELRRAADSAARHGAAGLKNILNSTSAAQANAVAAAADNTCDGSSVVLGSSDVQLVIWNSSTRKYTVTTDPTQANGVRVTARRTAANGNPIPLVFGAVIGRSNCDVTATAIATVTTGTSDSPTVSAKDNPFLSGMPSGSVASNPNPHNNPDYAPADSPVQANISINPGSTLTFDGVNGGANNFSSTTLYDADGNTGWICNNSNGPENGISDMSAPINCLVGVFMDNSQPSTSSPPASLDFSTATARDFSTLKPALKQIFFIGDGRRSTGEVQNFVVPTGATRLFIGTWDAYEWNNNVGSFNLTVHTAGNVQMVQ
jgi:Flp pilus assembly protein TadG